MLELAERCEQAAGPDRDLDARLHCVREELEFVCIGSGRESYGSICDPSDSGYGTSNTTTPGMLYARYPDHKNLPTLGGGKRGNIVQGCTPAAFTASLDAAMTLVPEGHFVTVMNARDGKDRPELGYGLSIVCDANSVRSDEPSQAATMPLALCAAALRARGETL